MSSYRGGGAGAWDGGPPGAEAEYAGAQPYAPPLPPTDPWTGVSYSQYQQPYDYRAYNYGYSYDSTYYRPDAAGAGYYKYPDGRTVYAGATGAPSTGAYSSEYTGGRRSRSRSDERRRRSYSRSRSGSRERYRRASPERRRRRSTPRSRSRSYERARAAKRRSASSDSSSDRSYKASRTPPRRSRSPRTPARSPSRSPRLRKDTKSHSTKNVKIKREEVTPPPPSTSKVRVKTERASVTPPKTVKIKTERSSVTPPMSYRRDVSVKREKDSSVSPPRSYKESSTKRKHKDSSLTPPRSYARSRGSSSSHSRSRSPSPRKRKRSSSRSASRSPRRRRSTPRRRRRRSRSGHSRSRSRGRSKSRDRSKSRRRSKSKSKSKAKKRSPSRSRSKSKSSRSKSRSRSSGTPSDDERRGQFTVADRKRFWKTHRTRIEEKRGKERTPPKELVPPPGAVEKIKADDIEYSDPPEVEGPNFAELLPAGKALDPALLAASTSKPKNIPIPIKNDGSFLEMFKKLQEETKKLEDEKKPEIKKPLPFIGKRRGGRVLKTGMVKKAKAIDEQSVDNTPKDAWSLYMQEVKKYRETSCEEERKTRPLVK